MGESDERLYALSRLEMGTDYLSTVNGQDGENMLTATRKLY